MDREKVIKELDDSLKNQHCGFVDGVGDVYAVSEETIKNIIALLKEQEAVQIVRCKDCKYNDENECIIKAGWFPVKPDWFCADGCRKEG